MLSYNNLQKRGAKSLDKARDKGESQMEKLTNKLKNSLTFKNRSIRAAFLVFLALILSQITLPAEILASSPKFNFQPGDYQLLRGANATAGEQEWHDPVAAAPEDSVAMIAYYHNGIEQTVARNTKIRVELPQTPSKTLISNGYLWADNATQVTDTFVVNVSQNAFLEYIPGTTQHYTNGNQTPQPLPDGITSVEGLNIGDVVGCWEYAGYVVFQVKIKAPGVADIAIEKKVANSTTDAGSQNWTDQNTASPGDILAYRLYFANPGTATATNVIVSDVLPGYVTYLNGTTKLYTNTTGTDGQSLPNTITTTGIALGDLDAGGASSGYIVFQVKINPNLVIGNYTLTNIGRITATNVVHEKQDTAVTIVNITGQADLVISKTVRNLTKNEENFVEQNTASVGNILEYKLEFASNGTATAKNVVIKDALPQVSGIPIHYIKGSTKLYIAGGGQKTLPDTITSTGVAIGDLAPTTEGYVTFKVRIDNCPAVGQFTLINTGKISASNVSQKKDTAVTHLTVTPPPQPYLNLEKLVKNESKGEIEWFNSNIAVPGDTLQYYVWFKNVGDGSASELLVKDVLPSQVSYIPGTTILHINGEEQKLADGIAGPGISIPDLIPGKEGYTTFKVRVNENVADKTVLTDIAHIYSGEGCHAQDSATTTINIPYEPQAPVIKIKQSQTQTQYITTGEVKGAKLPPTGGMATVALVITSAIVGTWHYIKAKKELLAEYAKSRML